MYRHYLIGAIAMWLAVGAKSAVPKTLGAAVAPYNSRIVMGASTEGKPLYCKGFVAPPSLTATGPFPDWQHLDSQFDFGLEKMTLSQQASTNGQGYDLRWAIVLLSDTPLHPLEAMLPPQRHGCESDLYPTSESVSTGPNGAVSLNVSMFMAERKCWTPPSSSRRPYCSAEGTENFHGNLRFVAPPIPYERCAKFGKPDSRLFTIESDGLTSDGGGAPEKCFGVNVSTLGVLSLVTGHLAPALMAFAANDNVRASLPALDLGAGLAVKPSQDVALCPDPEHAIQTEVVKPNRLRVTVNEVRKNLPKPYVCQVFRKYETNLFMLAEQANPTRSVQVGKGDSLWTIAARLWVDGRLYPLLVRENKLKKGLQPGQVLRVPNIENALSDPSLIREGDSLWLVRKRLGEETVSYPALLRRISVPRPRNKELIFPFAKVSPLRPHK